MALALIIILTWGGLGLFLPTFAWSRKLRVLAGSVAAGAVSVVTFVALNPFMTAHPAHPPDRETAALAELGVPQRAWLLVVHRMAVSRQQQRHVSPHNAVTTPLDKLEVVAVQGFGRFGLFGPRHSDSTRRFDLSQDLGALILAPLGCGGRGLGRAARPGATPCGRTPHGLGGARSGDRRPGGRDGLSAAGLGPLLPLAPAGRGAPRGGSGGRGHRSRSFQPRPRAQGGLNVRIPASLHTPHATRHTPHTPRWVFLILLGSYAFFWQARDWNSASRLVLTCAVVDRGTVTIDGMERQTNDIARFRRHFYTDKLPGFSILAIPSYAPARIALRLPGHPLNGPALAYWPTDYWVTLSTSGLLTALTGAGSRACARDLGCGPRRAALVGLAYGLGTPAYAYATLSYGHQPAAAALFGAFALLWRTDPTHLRFRMALAGFFAAFAAVIEIQVGLISALLGFYLLRKCSAVANPSRRWPGSPSGPWSPLCSCSVTTCGPSANPGTWATST